MKPFPRLNSVKTGRIQPIERTSTNTVLPPLEHISYYCDTLDTSAFAFLANFCLSTLEIKFRSTSIVNAQSSTLPRLDSLNKLSLEFKALEDNTESVWTSSLATIIAYCPNITSLRLFDPVYPDYRVFLSSISHIAFRITSLELVSLRLLDDWDIACDHLLPQFSNLIDLSLGDGTVSPSLPSYLRHLAHLRSLRMGLDAHYNLEASDFFALLQGPTRHPSLQQLAFHCFGGSIGRRVQVNEILFQAVEEGMVEEGWERPRFLSGFSADDALTLQSICEENKIEYEGDAAAALQIQQDFNLEDGNRSVLRCLHLEFLDDLTSSDGSAYFAHIPIDNLDSENLKLVKTDLPEKNWFRLSLE